MTTERRARIAASPQYRGGRFHNPVPSRMIVNRELLKEMTRQLEGRAEREPRGLVPLIPLRRADFAVPPATGLRATWLGHSTVLLELDRATAWVLAGPRHKVFFTGDTSLYDGLADIGRAHGPFDLDLMKIGAYSEAWPAVHLTPEEALRAHAMLGGPALLAIHWGTFNLTPAAHEPGALAGRAGGWGIAFFEYCFQVPANRMGYSIGMSAAELKTMQEVITLGVFVVFATFYLKEPLKWTTVAGFVLIGLGATLVYAPWSRPDVSAQVAAGETPR